MPIDANINKKDDSLFNMKQSMKESARSSKESDKKLGIYFLSTNKLLDTVGVNTYETNKLLQLNNKTFTDFSQHLTKTLIGAMPKKDPFKRKDPTDRLIKELDDLQRLTALNKPKDVKKGGLGLGLFGGLLALGGLLGYLMTGKTEFLNNIWKGLTKYSPVRIFVDIFDKGLTKVVKFVPKIFEKILHIPLIGKALKPITTIFGHLGGFVKGIGELLGKMPGVGLVSKIGGKVGGKIGKAFLKKIPFVGAAFGLWFGIDRFKKGDILGGALEIISGVSSIVPGVGTALSIALDSFLIMRDVIGTKKTDQMVGGAVKKAAGVSVDYLRKIPGIGQMIGLYECITDFTKDPMGTINSMISLISTISPEIGAGLQGAVGWVTGLKDNPIIKTMMNNPVTQIMGKAGEAVSGVAGKLKTMVFGKGDVVTETPTLTPKPILTPAVMQKLQTGVGTGVEKAVEAGKGITRKVGQQLGFYLSNDSVNVKGVDPAVWNNFTGMAQEYYDKTGKRISVNSAYRSIEEQKVLWNKYGQDPKRVARPGSSLHNFGLAIDAGDKIGTYTNEMASMGLLNKWHFNRPLSNEAWHLEPKEVDRKNKVLSANYPMVDTANAVGDAISPMSIPTSSIANNLPTSKIPPRNINTNERTKMDLSEATIALLAKSITEGYKSSIPKPVRSNNNIQINARS